MFFSSLLILIFHLWINIFDRTSNLYNIEEFIRTTCFIGVDIFFFLSSYSIAKNNKKNYKEFIISRFKKVYIPYIIFTLIALFYMNLNFKTFIFNITSINLFIKGGGSFLWFIPAIMMLYLILPLYKKIDNKYKITPLIVLIIWLILTILFSLYSSYDHLFIFTNRIPIILLGYYCSKINIFEKMNKKTYFILMSLLILFGTIIFYNFRYTNISFIKDAFYIFAIPLTLGLILLIDLIPSNKVINLLGSITLEIYAIQMIFGYKITELLLFEQIPLLTNILTIIIMTILSLIVHYILNKVVTKMTRTKIENI